MKATDGEGVVSGFGAYLRDLRETRKKTDERYSLRGWAKLVGLSPAYLSAVENDGTNPPHPKHLRIMAELLGVDYEELLARSGRLDDEIMEVMTGVPEARALVRSTAALAPDCVSQLCEIAEILRAQPEAMEWFGKVVTGVHEGKAGHRAIRI